MPIRKKPRRFSPKENIGIERQAKMLLEAKKIEPSCSPWRSNVLLVPKADNTMRMCIDFRPRNEVTVKDAQSLLNISELLDEFQGRKYFSAIDLFSGYFQISLDEPSKGKSAYWTKFGLFQYTVMPFGLCNAPATFQRTLEMTLQYPAKVFAIAFYE